MEPQYYITIIVATIAALPGVFSLFIQRKREKIDNSAKLVNTAMILQEEIKKEFIALKKEFLLLKEENDKTKKLIEQYEALVIQLIAHTKKLIAQLSALGETPVVSEHDILVIEEKAKNLKI